MSQRFNGIIAQQTVPFRGTSQITVTNLPNFKTLDSGRYMASITGGVSGSFGILVLSAVNGLTYTIAGNTTVATGLNVLYPTSWAADGTMSALETSIAAANQQLTDVLPPTHVAFQSAIATAGISATITVIAALTGGC